MGTKQLRLLASSCRLCLNEDAFQLPIFGQSAQEKQILVKIEYCLPNIKVSEDDNLPKHICYKCLSLLDTTYEFWKKCSGSESLLRSRFSGFNSRHYKRTPYKRQQNLLSQCPKEQPKKIGKDDMETSPDLLEMIERETSQGLEITDSQKSYSPTKVSHFMRDQTASSVEHRNVVNFWKQNLPHQNSLSNYPTAEEHVNGNDGQLDAMCSHTLDNTSQKLLNIDFLANDNSFCNNFNIPQSWYTEAAKYHINIDPNVFDVKMQSPVENNNSKNNTFFSTAIQKQTAQSELLQQPPNGNAQQEASRSNDFPMSILKVSNENESEEFARTRNLLKRFRSLQTNTKQ